MASIEVGPLSHNLDDEEVALLEEAFEDADIDLSLDEDAEPRLIEADIDEAIFDDFLDRLDVNNLSCDIYVASDFEEVLEVGDYRIGSAQALLTLLEELRDDIFEEESDDDDDGEELSEFDEDEEEEYGEAASDGPGGDLKGDYMRFLWKTMFDAARACMTEGTAMYLRR